MDCLSARRPIAGNPRSGSEAFGEAGVFWAGRRPGKKVTYHAGSTTGVKAVATKLIAHGGERLDPRIPSRYGLDFLAAVSSKVLISA
jgi:hypothetical protein